MSLTVCPAAIAEAPIEVVWENLIQPAHYSFWADAQVERTEPDGPAIPGQTINLTAKELGLTWRILFKIEEVNAEKHRLRLHAYLPLGLQIKPAITCTAVDATTCRIQYG